jgi:hypothetical protein
MADIARIKGNISKMIAQDAPEVDIDAYVASEGVSLDQLRAPATPEAGIGEDVAKSAGAGLIKGAAGMLGLGGDAGSLLGSGVDYAGSALGRSPDRVTQFKELMARGARNNPVTALPANILQGPSSQDLQGKVEGVTGPLYKPQTTAGEYAQTGAEFLPGMIGGPGSIGAKLLTRVAAPALASETAGQLTKDTGAEPYARVGGALLGGFGAAKALQPKPPSSIPSSDDLLQSGSRGFEAVKASDAVINPSSVRQMAKDIKTELLNEGRHPTSEGQAGLFSALDRLEEMGKSAGGVTPKDMEVIRKNLVDLKKSPNPSAAGAARDATESFMQKYAGMGQSDLLNGTNPFPTLKNAIGDWAAGKRSNALRGKVDLANLNAGTAGTGANEDNALRQAIKQLARPINNTNTPVAKRLGFNEEEIAGIKGAAMGTPVGNAARFIGKAAPTGIVSGAMSSGAGGMAGGPVGMVALPAAGYVAKKIGDLSTKNAVSALDSLVRSRSPLAAQVAAQLPPQVVSQLNPKTQALLAGLIAADPVLAKQMGGPVGQTATN